MQALDQCLGGYCIVNSTQKNTKCKMVSEEITILRLVGRTQPESRKLLRTAFLFLSMLPSKDLILRPIS